MAFTIIPSLFFTKFSAETFSVPTVAGPVSFLTFLSFSAKFTVIPRLTCSSCFISIKIHYGLAPTIFPLTFVELFTILIPATFRVLWMVDNVAPQGTNGYAISLVANTVSFPFLRRWGVTFCSKLALCCWFVAENLSIM